jgi:hypothetical protein
VGVAALVRLIIAAGDRMSPAVWVDAVGTLASCASDTRPAVRELVEAVAGRPTEALPAAEEEDAAAEVDADVAAVIGTPAAAAVAAAALEADSPWEAKSPEDSPRGAQGRAGSVSGERRQARMLFFCSTALFWYCVAACRSMQAC